MRMRMYFGSKAGRFLLELEPGSDSEQWLKAGSGAPAQLCTTTVSSLFQQTCGKVLVGLCFLGIAPRDIARQTVCRTLLRLNLVGQSLDLFFLPLAAWDFRV
ncbi:unnamed protein product [Symbiodinium natans]|uniref:Uncharacterized protein n=1 Tax=Symbiodinium natans TaxID=878477 RepID=A0A812JRD3_9DINO|nr:unnamed protein product [Symbiodinium natans]